MASEYLKWKYRDVRPGEKKELTAAERRRNWWYYRKWHVLAGAALALIGAQLVYHALTQVHPDYQLAYVGFAPLSEEDAAAWEARLAALGTDANGDGKVVVQMASYLSSQEDAMYSYASSVKLMADLTAGESCFFLLEDPEGFQTGYAVLQEDWFPVGNGLYLARRKFADGKTAAFTEECGSLWERLAEAAWE